MNRPVRLERRRALRGLLAVTPQSRLAPTAVRAGLSIGVPLTVLTAAGRSDLALYATFGAFTAVYGRRADGRADVAVQARHALVLTAAVATGAAVALSADRAWWGVAAAAGWAALAAHLSDRQGWRPPGPLFCVFAVGACSAVALSSWSDVLAAVGVTPATAGLALLLGAAGRLVPPPTRGGSPAVAAGGASPTHAPPAPHRRHVQAARCAVAVVVAGALGTAAGPHPYWAMVAAVAPMAAPTLSTQLVRAAHRALGTLAGLGVAAALLALPLTTATVVALAVLLQVLAELTVSRHYGTAMLAVTPLALLLGQLAHPVPAGELLTSRGVETLVGVAVGVLVVVATRTRDATAPRGRPA